MALEVGADHLVERLFLQGQKIAARNDAGIVDEDIDALKSIRRRADEITNIETLADIAVAENRFATAIRNFGRDTLARLFLDIGKHDLCALVRIGMCDGAPDAAGRAGHDRHLAAQCSAGCHETAPFGGRGIISPDARLREGGQVLRRSWIDDRDIWRG